MAKHIKLLTIIHYLILKYFYEQLFMKIHLYTTLLNYKTYFNILLLSSSNIFLVYYNMYIYILGI